MMMKMICMLGCPGSLTNCVLIGDLLSIRREGSLLQDPFKSPLDPDFNVRCNDDLLSVTSSVTSEANTSIQNLKKETRNWKLKQQREVSAKLDRPCSEDVRLKRAPLPTSITWNGNAGKPLEDYISKFKGHVAQQDRLGYIFKDELHRLWVKHGDPKRVLLIGIRTKINPFLSFISVNQILFDIMWLYGMLQQSLPAKGGYHCQVI